MRAMIEGFYACPEDAWQARAMQDICATQRWIHGMGRGDDMTNAATTFMPCAARPPLS